MHRNFESTRLVRLLGAAAPGDNTGPRQDIAERLGQWLHAFDAVTLHAAHQSLQAPVPPRPGYAQPAAAARQLAQEIEQARAGLARAIVQAAEPGGPEPQAGFTPYRQRHLELQRQMESAIEPLRARARQFVARASPPLRQLAALDAVWEQMLAPREQRLLGGLAAWLERRFAQLRAAGEEEAVAGEEQALARAEAAAPPAWSLAFVREWQDVLGAELELRLEPVVGLLEAFNEEIEKV